MTLVGALFVGMLVVLMLGISLTILVSVTGALIYPTICELLDRAKGIGPALGAFELQASSRFTPRETPIFEG